MFASQLLAEDTGAAITTAKPAPHQQRSRAGQVVLPPRLTAGQAGEGCSCASHLAGSTCTSRVWDDEPPAPAAACIVAILDQGSDIGIAQQKG
jgi:hypothetical protein